MSKHLKMHRGIKPERLQCHVCEKTLCSANALKVHIETIHEGIRRFTCKFCENTFIYASHLKRHILVVHYNYKNPKAICPDCGKQFKFISTMKRHRRVSHLGEVVRKRHFCPQSNKSFTRNPNWLDTYAINTDSFHPGERLFEAERISLKRAVSLQNIQNLLNLKTLTLTTNFLSEKEFICSLFIQNYIFIQIFGKPRREELHALRIYIQL